VEKRLTALRVAAIAAKGNYPDGGGLYLQVQIGKDGKPRKSWLFRFVSPIERRERFMGLGSLDHISLAEARKARDEARETIRRGADPIEERGRVRERTQIEERLQAARSMSFDDCARAYFSSHKAAWKNPKHRQQFVNTLVTYVSPVFGSLPVSSIDTALVCAALEKDNLWAAKPETASRVRGRIENILAWAAVRGYRTNPNPAQWKNHLDHLLPPQSKVHRVKHHSALPYRELPPS
jgi:hypothetical protein